MHIAKNFYEEGTLYKGNVHCHSTVSDGKLSPEELVEAYKAQNYSFLVLSEHDIYTNSSRYDSKDFIVIPGIEREIGLPNREVYHIHGIGNTSSSLITNNYLDNERIPIIKYDSINDVQQIINELKSHGNLVMINHPYWSLNSASNINKLTNFDLIEIYNHGCEIENLSGTSDAYYDEILRANKRVNCIASDDNHNLNSDNPFLDSFGGWIKVKCKALSANNIYTAIKNGDYFSSCGPDILQYEANEDIIKLNCSPCKTVVFLTYPRRGKRIDGDLNHPITEASYKFKGHEEYVRIKIIDFNGNAAWSNPIYFSK